MIFPKRKRHRSDNEAAALYLGQMHMISWYSSSPRPSLPLHTIHAYFLTINIVNRL
jgi:hypothetical protein